MKKHAGMFLFLVLAFTIVLALTCGMARAQNASSPFQLLFSDLTETGVGWFPDFIPADLQLPIFQSPASTNEQRTVDWAVTTNEIPAGHSVIVALLEPGSATAVSDYLVITQNTGQLHMQFQSDTDTGPLTIPTVDDSTTTMMTETGTSQVVFSFTVPAVGNPDESDFCNGDTSCNAFFDVLVASDVEPTPPPSGVPEPATILLLGAGLIGALGLSKKPQEEA